MVINALIIDDNDFNLVILNEYLEDEGFETTGFENALLGLEYLEDNYQSVDIILLDRMMPYMNGLEMFKKLQDDERFKDIPVIMVTAAADRKAVAQAKEAGIKAYITKPFERDVLLREISKALGDKAIN